MKKQLVEAEQLAFPGGVFQELNYYADKVKEYEAEKVKLQNTCTTYEEYEKKIQELIKRLNL